MQETRSDPRDAIRLLEPERLRELLDAGADPNRSNPADQPLLHEAIQMWETGRHGWAAEAVPQMIAALLAAGANVNERGENDFTPLHEAALRADAAICEQLIRSGADVRAVAEPFDDEAGRTPYEVAASRGRSELAAFLQAGIPAEELERRRQQKAAARQAYLDGLRRGRGEVDPSA